MNEWMAQCIINMTFILRIWAYFYLLVLTPLPLPPNKSVSIQIAPLALIVSSRSLVRLLAIPTSLSFAPVALTTVLSLILFYSPGAYAAKTVSSTPMEIALSEARNEKGTNTFSNITLLDLYPELKDYLWKKALNQIISTTTPKSGVTPYTEGPYYLPSLSSYNTGTDYNTGQQQLQEQYNTAQSGWGWGGDYNAYYGTLPGGQSNNAVGNSLPVMPPPPSSGSIMGVASGSRDGIGQWNSRESNLDADTQESSYNYQKEVLKHWYPFGSPEFYDSWKFKPSPPLSSHHHQHHPPPPVSSGWSSLFPFLEEAEESHQVTHELSKDFSCLAGLLGLKTLKTLKFAVIFKKLKMLAIFFIAFKLGVLLSPIAIPLLFPIIILVTVVKILPLILIIVLLLKILKKQVKIKKPFGKYLESTGSLFFDDVEYVTEKILSSDDEYIDKLTSGIKKKKSAEIQRSKSKSIKDVTVEVQITSVAPKPNKRVNSRMLS